MIAYTEEYKTLSKEYKRFILSIGYNLKESIKVLKDKLQTYGFSKEELQTLSLLDMIAILKDLENK